MSWLYQMLKDVVWGILVGPRDIALIIESSEDYEEDQEQQAA